MIQRIFFLFFCVCVASVSLSAQPFSYKPNELMQPKDLADLLKANKAGKLHILNMGVERNIKNAIEIGIVSSPSKYKGLQDQLKKYKKNEAIVIYCGCCKLENCPNVSLAIEKIRELGYTNVRILNFVDGINEDWIDKGYPMAF